MVLRARVAMAGCPGEQAALQAEAEQVIARYRRSALPDRSAANSLASDRDTGA